MGSTVFRNPRALSSALASLGTLQPRALGFLNTVDPLDTVSNCYIDLQNDGSFVPFESVLAKLWFARINHSIRPRRDVTLPRT